MSGISWSDVERQCKSNAEKPKARSFFRQWFESYDSDCFPTALVLLRECHSALHNRSIPVASLLLDELENFASRRFSDRRRFLTVNMKHDALCLAVDLKHSSLIEKLCRTFCLPDDKLYFVPVVNDLLAKRSYTEACTFVVALELQDQYALEDIAIPLIFQDKCNMVESYVRRCPDLQLELVKYLDALTGNPDLCDQVIRRLHLSEVKMVNLRPKTMGKLVARLIKLYDIPPETCPNLSTYRSIGALKYLISRKYVEGNINDESWDELVKSTVGGNEAIVRELVTELVCANEHGEALKWAELYHLPRCHWPDALLRYQEEQGNRSVEGVKGNEEEGERGEKSFWDEEDSSRRFLSFPLQFGDIWVVDNVQQFISCMEFVTNFELIGIDGEWKPTFGLSASKMSLLQVAVFDAVFLLDMLALRECLESHHWTLLVDGVLANRDLIKLGYGFTSDLDMLGKALPCGKEGLKGIKRIIDLSHFCDKMKVLHPDLLAPESDSDGRGLSHLTHTVLGLPLDKTEQFSDWERRPLRPSQILYAAQDAYCLLQIYDSLFNKALALGLDFDSLLTESMNNGAKNKKESKTKASGKRIAAIIPREEVKEVVGGFDASEFRVVADNMLQGLGRHLRLCGVNAIILENHHDHDDCAKIAQRENRFILTSGAPYQMLKGHVPDGMCMNVPCELTAPEQAELVFSRYNVKVTRADIFSRCPVCNGGKYQVIPSTSLKSMWLCKEGTTVAGVPIGLHSLSRKVFERVDAFDICVACGKVFWEGSHHAKMLRQLADIISP